MDRKVNWLNASINRWKADEYFFVSIIAILVGILAGYGAVLFRYAIIFFQSSFYGSGEDFLRIAQDIAWYKKLIFPAVGGAIVGPIIYFWAREAKGHGVPEVMEAVAIRGGHIRSRVTAVKIVASALSIGCGGSVGREGPIVQIGSALGSTIGQILKVSQDRMRTLVGCGAAAGIAATFNAPIAGVFFSLEILLGEFGVKTFSPIVLSSVTATAISRHYFGDYPAFSVPRYEMVSVWEFFLYAAMGVMISLVAVFFVTTLYKAEDLFKAVPIRDYLKPILGGLIMGAFIIFLPQTFGVGYGTIDLSVVNGLTMWMLFLLIFAKIAATSITIGGGMSGGIFAPSLFIGAVSGGFFGSIVHTFLPDLTASSGAYALVGMGAMVAAVTHAPITAILIIFELTSEYTIILPLMITCIISTLLARYLKNGNIYTIKLMRRGIMLRRGREQSILRNILVSEVMRPEVYVIKENTFLTDIMKTFQEHNASYLQVVNEKEELSGIISFRDIRQVIQERQLGQLVIAKDVATSPVVTMTPEENIDDALRKMGVTGVSQLPVVDQDQPDRVIGVIYHKDVTAAYNRTALAMEEKT
ncbi:MAG: chloride channel protein [Deltaproteobacteria bacterium]|nr:chloride channel protein [Deltaproteobacteria bacterium]MBW2053437.1 chloride channel protein [Deltaproteobacteria bacterium]MBW2141616.1 chloride channel protein [Deltaproteobacteria bacterium]MBW2323692.1 chloride channel protein [Deltaproteobacteria bacterium]